MQRMSAGWQGSMALQTNAPGSGATSLRKHTMANVTLRIVIANGTQDVAGQCDKGMWRYKKEPAANCVATGSPS
jgi:hypothetical protein